MPSQGNQPVDDGASEEVLVAHISSNDTIDISSLLQEDPNNATSSSDSFHEQKLRDSTLHPIISYISKGILPDDLQMAAKMSNVHNGRRNFGQKSDKKQSGYFPQTIRIYKVCVGEYQEC